MKNIAPDQHLEYHIKDPTTIKVLKAR